MPGGDQLERQSQQQTPIVLLEMLQVSVRRSCQQALELGKIVSADKTELFEQRAVRFDVGEQINHHRGNLSPDGEKGLD